jgi:hypothetical protein
VRYASIELSGVFDARSKADALMHIKGNRTPFLADGAKVAVEVGALLQFRPPDPR